MNGPDGWKIYGDGDIYSYGSHVGKVYGYEDFLRSGSAAGASSSYANSSSGFSGGYGDSGSGHSFGEGSSSTDSSSGGVGCGTILVIVAVLLIISTYGMAYEGIVEGRFDDAVPAAILTAIFAYTAWKKYGKKLGAKANPSVVAGVKEKVKPKTGFGKPASSVKAKPVKTKPVETRPVKPAGSSSSDSGSATSGSQGSHAGSSSHGASSSGSPRISWEDDGDRVLVYCPACEGRSAVPRASGTLRISCPLCGKKFEKTIRLSEGEAKNAPSQNDGKVIVFCPACGEEMSVPRVSGTIRITCPSCSKKFERKA